MKIIPVLLFPLLIIFSFPVFGQGEWVLKKDHNGIKVFSKKSSLYKFDELKVECEFEGRISQLAAVLLDINNQAKWVYKTAKSQLLKEVSPTELFFYTEINCPWPFENRDMVVKMNIRQDKISKLMTVEARNAPGYLEVKPKIVRIAYSNATWKVMPINNHLFKIEYRLQIDPGNGIPAWLLNMFASNGPYETFISLKERIHLPQYAQARFPFLID